MLTHLMKQTVPACQQLEARASAAGATNEAAGVIGIDWNKRRLGGFGVGWIVFAQRKSQLFLDSDVTSASLNPIGRRAVVGKASVVDRGDRRLAPSAPASIVS